jgi:hypothetical protein
VNKTEKPCFLARIATMVRTQVLARRTGTTTFGTRTGTLGLVFPVRTLSVFIKSRTQSRLVRMTLKSGQLIYPATANTLRGL